MDDQADRGKKGWPLAPSTKDNSTRSATRPELRVTRAASRSTHAVMRARRA
jgi:hypothetical protein